MDGVFDMTDRDQMDRFTLNIHTSWGEEKVEADEYVGRSEIEPIYETRMFDVSYVDGVDIDILFDGDMIASVGRDIIDKASEEARDMFFKYGSQTAFDCYAAIEYVMEEALSYNEYDPAAWMYSNGSLCGCKSLPEKFTVEDIVKALSSNPNWDYAMDV